jgi:hypothetical protein
MYWPLADFLQPYAITSGRVVHGVSTLSIMAIRITTISKMTLSLKGLLVTQHNNTEASSINVIVLSVAFYFILC